MQAWPWAGRAAGLGHAGEVQRGSRRASPSFRFGLPVCAAAYCYCPLLARATARRGDSCACSLALPHRFPTNGHQAGLGRGAPAALCSAPLNNPLTSPHCPNLAPLPPRSPPCHLRCIPLEHCNLAVCQVGPPAASGEGRARRSFVSPDELVSSPQPGKISVLAHILDHAVSEFGNVQALGWRDTIKVISEDKEVKKLVGGKETTETKTWNYFQLSEYKWWTYNDFKSRVTDVGGALRHVGCSDGTVFNIYSSTSPRWQVFANACASQSITFATAYDSLGEEGLRHSINEPEGYGIFTNAALLGTLASVAHETPSLRVVVYDGAASDIPTGALDKLKATPPSADGKKLEVYTFDEFVQLGKEHPSAPHIPKPEDIACLMYTSGSTGPPKGVQITNANVVACIGAVQKLLGHVVCKGETYIAYLPLAHIMEFAVEMCFMYVGARMGYGNGASGPFSSSRRAPWNVC